MSVVVFVVDDDDDDDDINANAIIVCSMDVYVCEGIISWVCG